MTHEDDDLVLVQRRDADLWVTLNRPEKANAMTVAMIERVTAAIAEAAGRQDVRAVILSGSGEKIFSAGVDVREKAADGDAARQRERRSHASAALQDAVLDTPKPIVVALNGAAIGGGAMLALLADACIACESASLSLPEIDIGIPTFSGASILETIGGRALARDLVQTGRRLEPQDAVVRGLYHATVPRADLRARATSLAALLGSKDSRAFADNKRWLNHPVKAALTEARREHARHREASAK